MSIVVFHWETPKGFDNPHAKKRLLARWVLTCKSFGVHTLFCVSDEVMVVGDTEVTFKHFHTLEDALSEANGELVYVEEGGSPLETFEHPENAVYVFGSDYKGLEVNNALTINTLLPIHAEVAAGIILHHRGNQWL